MILIASVTPLSGRERTTPFFLCSPTIHYWASQYTISNSSSPRPGRSVSYSNKLFFSYLLEFRLYYLCKFLIANPLFCCELAFFGIQQQSRITILFSNAFPETFHCAFRYRFEIMMWNKKANGFLFQCLIWSFTQQSKRFHPKTIFASTATFSRRLLFQSAINIQAQWLTWTTHILIIKENRTS